MFITPRFQLFYRSEIFQNRKLGKKQKYIPNLAKQNNLSQVFKDAYLSKKTVKREGCDPGVKARPWLPLAGSILFLNLADRYENVYFLIIRLLQSSASYFIIFTNCGFTKEQTVQSLVL